MPETYNPLNGAEIKTIGKRLCNQAWDDNADLKENICFHGIIGDINATFFLLVDISEPPKDIDRHFEVVKGLKATASQKAQQLANDVEALVKLRLEIDKAIADLTVKVTAKGTIDGSAPALARKVHDINDPELDYIKSLQTVPSRQ